MDWNKSNTVLIIAFIIVNIFLMIVASTDVFADGRASAIDKDYVESVRNVLAEKNIMIACNIPEDIYTVPFLDAEFDIIEPRTVLLRKFLGPDVEPVEDVYFYTNDSGESLGISENKKIKYSREKSVSEDSLHTDDIIKSFVNEKNIDMEGFRETDRYTGADYVRVTYNEFFEDLPIENSYMVFYVDGSQVYMYEAQRIKEDGITKKGRVSSGDAAGSLLRLITYEGIENKVITDIRMTYYCAERDDWSLKTSSNAYPVWKVMFSDGDRICLPADD